MSKTKQFPADTLDDILDRLHPDYTMISNEIWDQGRWTVRYTLVFRDNESGELWGVNYEEGATEMQDDTDRWGYARDVECDEFEPYITTSYRAVKHGTGKARA